MTIAPEAGLDERFAPTERDQAHLMLSQYAGNDVEQVRRALLALSDGNLGKLGYYLAAAQHRYQDLLYWAKHPDQAPQR